MGFQAAAWIKYHFKMLQDSYISVSHNENINLLCICFNLQLVNGHLDHKTIQELLIYLFASVILSVH